VDGLVQLLSGNVYDYWAPSRVIPYTINEFPFWTFLFADLHPHLIAMPFGMLLVGLSLNWLLSWEERGCSPATLARVAKPGRAAGRSFDFVQDFLNALLLALSLGAMGAINTWDLPSYFLLLLGTFVLIGWRKRRPSVLLANVLTVFVTGALAVVAYWPFYAHYRSQVSPGTAGGIFGSTGQMLLARYLDWTRSASPLGDWLLVWGILLFLAYSFTLWELKRRPPTRVSDTGVASESAVPRSERLGVIGLLTLIGLAASVAVLERPTAALVAIPLVLAFVLALRRWAPARDAFLHLLLALGLGIVAGMELVYVRDFLAGGDWYRMNTVFKFSIPAWLFMGLALGAMLGRRWDLSASLGASTFAGSLENREISERRGRSAGLPVRAIWSVSATGLLIAGLVFLVFGAPSRVKDRFPGRRPVVGTLDGTAYMTVGTYTWPDPDHVIELAYDYQAIHWMLDQIQGTPVVAEAPAGGYELDGQFQGYDYYRAGGLRVSSLTGFPTFVGQHQNEQRPGDQVSQRAELGQEFFRTADIARTKELIQELNVDYIYVGALERTLFPQVGLDKFDSMVESGDLLVAYHNPMVTIYQVNAAIPG
jgi:YYY domain-containing protein